MIQIKMLETKRFRRVHRLLQWMMVLIGGFLTIRSILVPHNNGLWFLISLVSGLALAGLFESGYRRWFKDGVPHNDTTDMISPSNYNIAGRQLLYAFLKGVGGAVVYTVLNLVALVTIPN